MTDIFDSMFDDFDENGGVLADFPPKTIERIISYLENKYEVASSERDQYTENKNGFEYRTITSGMKFLANGILFLKNKQENKEYYISLSFILDMIYLSGFDLGTYASGIEITDYLLSADRDYKVRNNDINSDFRFSNILGVDRIINIKKHFSITGQSDYFKKKKAQLKKWRDENPGYKNPEEFNAQVYQRYVEIFTGKKMEAYDILSKEFNKSTKQIERIIKKETPSN